MFPFPIVEKMSLRLLNILFFLAFPLLGQVPEEEKQPLPGSWEELPQGYRAFNIGMSLQEVKAALLEDSYFDYRGDPDVSIRERESRSLVSAAGRGLMDQGFFQFQEDALYLIILQFNQSKIDFFTLSQRLIAKYGPPLTLSPQGMIWENDRVRLSLEYPLTLKYVSLPVFMEGMEESRQIEGFEETTRQKFLEDF